jgi:hypothetical protein
MRTQQARHRGRQQKMHLRIAGEAEGFDVLIVRMCGVERERVCAKKKVAELPRQEARAEKPRSSTYRNFDGFSAHVQII